MRIDLQLAVAFFGAFIVVGCGGGSAFSGSSKSAPAVKKPDATVTTPMVPEGGDAKPVPPSGDDADFEERLDREDALSGEIQISLLWNTSDDLDLHVVTPSGEHIYFNARSDASSGNLDVDMNATGGADQSVTPVENVYWPVGAAQRGSYKIYVHNFRSTDQKPLVPYKVRVKTGASSTVYAGKANWDKQTGLPIDPAVLEQYQEQYDDDNPQMIGIDDLTGIVLAHTLVY